MMIEKYNLNSLLILHYNMAIKSELPFELKLRILRYSNKLGSLDLC